MTTMTGKCRSFTKAVSVFEIRRCEKKGENVLQIGGRIVGIVSAMKIMVYILDFVCKSFQFYLIRIAVGFNMYTFIILISCAAVCNFVFFALMNFSCFVLEFSSTIFS